MQPYSNPEREAEVAAAHQMAQEFVKELGGVILSWTGGPEPNVGGWVYPYYAVGLLDDVQFQISETPTRGSLLIRPHWPSYLSIRNKEERMAPYGDDYRAGLAVTPISGRKGMKMSTLARKFREEFWPSYCELWRRAKVKADVTDGNIRAAERNATEFAERANHVYGVRAEVDTRHSEDCYRVRLHTKDSGYHCVDFRAYSREVDIDVRSVPVDRVHHLLPLLLGGKS